MNDLVGMHVMTCTNELNQCRNALQVRQTAAADEAYIHEWARRTELESHVDIIIVFEAIFEVNDIRDILVSGESWFRRKAEKKTHQWAVHNIDLVWCSMKNVIVDL